MWTRVQIDPNINGKKIKLGGFKIMGSINYKFDDISSITNL